LDHTLTDEGGALLPGVETFFSLLKMQDVWLWAVSGKSRREAEDFLKAYRLTDYFRGILAGEPVSAAVLERAERRLRVNRRFLTVFSRSPAVLLEAKAAGFHTAAVCPDADGKNAADTVISDFLDFIE